MPQAFSLILLQMDQILDKLNQPQNFTSDIVKKKAPAYYFLCFLKVASRWEAKPDKNTGYLGISSWNNSTRFLITITKEQVSSLNTFNKPILFMPLPMPIMKKKSSCHILAISSSVFSFSSLSCLALLNTCEEIKDPLMRLMLI